MIVTKCCHDFDILTWNLSSPIRRLTSAGSLFHFHPHRAPAGATERCSDGCPVQACPFDARRIYLDPRHTGWPVHVITDDLSAEGRLTALRTGSYGRCVYTAGSDVVDHQVVSMQTEDGTTVTLTMHGHSDTEERTMRYDGTKATLRGRFGRVQEITVADHATGVIESIPIETPAGGHGGGDEGIMSSFLDAIAADTPSETPADEAFESHLLAFLAEEARLTGDWIEVDQHR
jgi:predicted dehydrogenase